MRALGLRRRAAAALAVTLAVPALAQAPEQLEQLEPDRGRWQLEYHGLTARRGEDQHGLQALYGIGDRLAVGIELEGAVSNGRFAFEGWAPTLLYRFTDPDEAALGVGIEAQAELDGDFELASLETRLILEKSGPLWWVQGNAMLRHAREDGEWRTGIAYGWALSRRLADGLWLGMEGSGQAARGGQFAGPALTLAHDLAGGGELELGLAWQRRLAGDGPRDSARLFVQFSL